MAEPAAGSLIRVWAGRNSAACLVIIACLALTMCLPVAFLFIAMTSENFVGSASPIFFVPVGMLLVLGAPLVVLAIARVGRVRPQRANGNDLETRDR